jgi:hypothetical protein
MESTVGSRGSEALAYLETLFQAEHADSLIEIRCPKEPRLRRFFPVKEVEAAATYVAHWAGTTDVYVGVAPRIRIEEKQTGGKGAIDHVQALWADCDTTESIAKLAAFVPEPTIEVGSGGGVHAYWMLDAPVSKEQAEIGNRRLALALGGDSAATDAARVLRPTGTFNHKPERLVDGEPARVTLQALRKARYAWDEIVGTMPDAPARVPTTTTARTTGRSGADDPLLRIEPPVYVELLSGREVGGDGKALCPFHNDRETPNLHAYANPDEGWYCYSCERGGSVIEFGALLFGIEARGDDHARLRQRIAAHLLGEPT